MKYQNVSRSSGRRLLFAGCVAAVNRTTTYAQQQAPIPETLTQWLAAPARTRKLALERCLDRIQSMEPSIHAWVQTRVISRVARTVCACAAVWPVWSVREFKPKGREPATSYRKGTRDWANRGAVRFARILKRRGVELSGCGRDPRNSGPAFRDRE